MTSRRLFVGTFLAAEQQQMLERLKEHNQELSRLWGTRLRWVKAAKLHMTWVFLGDVGEQLIEQAACRLSSALSGYKPGRISFNRAEFWPSPRKPRQLVLAVQPAPDEMLSLGNTLKDELADFIARPEERRFRPHVTLLRFDMMAKNASVGPLKWPDKLDEMGILPLELAVDRVDLVESRIGSADEYKVLHSFSL
jgi:2'-5' RNA ligase